MDDLGENAMNSINACIYDRDGNLSGCVTESVLAQFGNEMENLFREFGEDRSVAGLLLKLDDARKASELGCTAVFLNALKLLVVGHRYDVPIGFLQAISKAYHNLVRLCCSGIVYDEVLNATIGQFREEGLEYIGTIDKVNGREAYAFVYDNVHVSVCMVEKNDLYNFWCRKSDDKVRAMISFNGMNILVGCADGPMLCDAVKACVVDLKDDGPECGCCRIDRDELRELASALLEVARMLAAKNE